MRGPMGPQLSWRKGEKERGKRFGVLCAVQLTYRSDVEGTWQSGGAEGQTWRFA